MPRSTTDLLNSSAARFEPQVKVAVFDIASPQAQIAAEAGDQLVFAMHVCGHMSGGSGLV